MDDSKIALPQLNVDTVLRYAPKVRVTIEDMICFEYMLIADLLEDVSRGKAALLRELESVDTNHGLSTIRA